MKEENVRIVYEPFDCDFRGATLCRYDNGEDYYTIIINSNLSSEGQYHTLRHEIAHIANNDFDSEVSIDELETIRHSI